MEEVTINNIHMPKTRFYGYTCKQVYDRLMSRMTNKHPMPSKAQGYILKSCQDFMRYEGVLEGLHRDLTSKGKVGKIIGAKTLKQGSEQLKNKSGAVSEAWSWIHKYIASVNNLYAAPVHDGRIIIKVHHRYTSDASAFLQFQVWEKVHLKVNDQHPDLNVKPEGNRRPPFFLSGNRQTWHAVPKPLLDAEFVVGYNNGLFNSSVSPLSSRKRNKTKLTKDWMRNAAQDATAEMVVVRTFTMEHLLLLILDMVWLIGIIQQYAQDSTGKMAATGVLLILNNTPGYWIYKNQKTMETSNYGAQIVSTRFTPDFILEYWYSLRMMERESDYPSLLPGNYNSVVLYCTMQNFVLKKKCSTFTYHRAMEAVVGRTMKSTHIPRSMNYTGILTKPMPCPRSRALVSPLLFHVPMDH